MTSKIIELVKKLFFLIPALLFSSIYYKSIFFGQAWGDDSYVVSPWCLTFKSMIKTFYENTGMVSDHYMPVHCLQCFLINYLFGESAFPFGFHLYQFIAQIIVCILATLLFYKISGSKLISVLTVALWTIHPVNQQQLTRLVVGPGIMGFAFNLIFLLSYLYSDNIKSKVQRNCLLVGGSFFFLLGVMSVEHFVFFPILLFLLLFYLKGKKIFNRNDLSLIICPLITYIIYFSVRFYITKGIMLEGENLVDRWAEVGSVKDILFRAFWFSPQLLIHYLKLYFYPYGLIDSAAEWYKVGESILSSYSLFCQIATTLLILLTVFLYKRFPLFSIGMVWFFLTLVLVIQIIPIFSIVSLRYAYLPSLGLTFALFSLISKLKTCSSPKVLIALSIPIFCFLISRTIYYMPSSQNFLNQFIYCTREAPVWNKPLWISLLIKQEAKEKSNIYNEINTSAFEESINNWLKQYANIKSNLATQFGPMQMDYNYMVFRVIFAHLASHNRSNDLQKVANAALTIKNNSVGWLEIATLFEKLGKQDLAWEAMKKSILLNPTNKLLYSLQFVDIAFNSKKTSEALALLDNLIKLIPNSSYPYLVTGFFYNKLQLPNQSLYYFKSAISPDKKISMDEENLYLMAASLFFQNKMLEETLRTFNIILSINPHNKEIKQALINLTHQKI